MTVEVKGAIMATSPKLKSEQAKGERELSEILGENEAEALFENRRKRDGDKAHITLAGPPDAKKAVDNLADRDGISKGEAERRIKTLAAEGVPDSFRVKGVGKAESGGKVAYFLVVDWPEGRAWRESVGLDPDGQDFHITLGFGPEGDVHSVPKNRLMRASNLPMKQAATGDALFDVKQELRGGRDLIEDGNYFDYEYVSLSSEAVKDVIRRLQGAGFLDFAMDEDGDLMATRPGGIEAAVEFDSWEENGRPWTEVAVEVFDPERSGESKMASHDLRSKLIRLAHARPDLRPTLLPLLSTETREAAYGMGPIPRSIFLPKDEPTLAQAPGLPEGLEVYTYHRPNSRGQVAYYGVAFAGKAQKPLWNYAFRDEAQRDRQIAETAKSVESRAKAMKERSDARKQFTHGLQVGDILYSSWGYDQTNIDWYEVVGVPTEKMILVREIAGKTLRSDGYGSDQVMPTPGKYVGPVMKKIPTGRAGHISVKISDVQTAWKWDGKPKSETSSGYGH